jgi:RNA polymerase sigma-70 factor (ECF subfamily)
MLSRERLINKMKDEQIIELYFARNEIALVETSDKYGNYCRTIAWNILYDRETADECFNDTLLQSWNKIPPTRPNSLKLFVGKIIRNLSLNRLNSKMAIKRGGGEIDLALGELEECVADPIAPSAEQIEDDMVIRDVMNTFLAGLSAQNRRLFVRRYWYCSSMKEIAAAMGMSEANVATTLLRIRGKLKEALEKAGVVL